MPRQPQQPRHEFLRHSDAFAWEMEHDAALRSTVVTILLLDRSPDFARVREAWERASHLVPMLRRRVVHSAPPAPPRWEDDPDFDLDFHVRRLTATAVDGAEPGLDELLELARRAEMDDFDRARPLWEATIVEGLTLDGEPACAALLLKLHHSLTDGIGGVQLALALLDLGPDPTEREPVPPVPAQPTPGRFTPWTASAAYDAGLVRGLATGLVRSAPALVRSGVLHPVDTARDVAAMSTSVMRTVRPINHTGSDLMGSGAWCAGWP